MKWLLIVAVGIGVVLWGAEIIAKDINGYRTETKSVPKPTRTGVD